MLLICTVNEGFIAELCIMMWTMDIIYGSNASYKWEHYECIYIIDIYIIILHGMYDTSSIVFITWLSNDLEGYDSNYNM